MGPRIVGAWNCGFESDGAMKFGGVTPLSEMPPEETKPELMRGALTEGADMETPEFAGIPNPPPAGGWPCGGTTPGGMAGGMPGGGAECPWPCITMVKSLGP